MHPRPPAGRRRRLSLLTAIERLEPRTLLAAATLLRDINPGGDARFNEPVAVGPAFFFSADDGTHGAELWKTDGTPEGTILVKDIRPGPEGSLPRTLTAVNGTLFFVADGATGSELWRSDGTEGGTVRVKDANPGSGSGVGIDFRMADLNGTLIFTGDDGTGPRLWKSDGTDVGTVPFAPGADIWSVAPFGGAVALSLHGYAYRTDGTASGTYPLAPDGIRDSNGWMVPAGGKLYFCGGDPANLSGDSAILWVSDGTPGAAHPVSGKVKFGATGVVAAASGFVYFFAFGDGDLRHSLWRTDGTDAGTVRLKELDLELPDEMYFGPGNDIAALGDTLLFTDGAFDSGNGQRPVEVLWKSDGTPRGTVALGMTAPFDRRLRRGRRADVRRHVRFGHARALGDERDTVRHPAGRADGGRRWAADGGLGAGSGGGEGAARRRQRRDGGRPLGGHARPPARPLARLRSRAG